MAAQKLVARVLDASATMLGWAEVPARFDSQARGLRVEPWAAVMTAGGTARAVVWHWCDLDVCWQQAVDQPVAVGLIVQFDGGVVLQLADDARCRPLACTVIAQPVTVAPLMGGLGARG